ncbi:MAG: hypothetical protein ACRD4Q_12690 [Candidatus Acidiferrales bacterium]
MAIRQHGDKCSNIEFSKYFRVDREVTDQQATQLLGYIGAVLKDWKAHKSATKKSSTINLDQLRRIDLSEKNGESMVEFAFEVDGTGVQVFDVELPVVGKPHYSTTLEIP